MINDISGVPKWDKVSVAVCVPIGRRPLFSPMSHVSQKVVLDWLFAWQIRPCQVYCR